MSNIWDWIWNNDRTKYQYKISEEILADSTKILESIENLIQQELAFISSYDSILKSVVPKSKSISASGRHGWNPSHKRRHRKSPKQKGPILIKPLTQIEKSIETKGMVYNPSEKIWKGNEEELYKFRAAPPLISNRSPNPKTPIIKNNMVYDPARQMWIGNDDDLLLFDSLLDDDDNNNNNNNNNHNNNDKNNNNENSEEDKSNFKVGIEFQLSEEMIEEYKEQQREFEVTLKGWKNNKDKIDRINGMEQNDLYEIRSMSITKIVTQIKANYSTLPVLHKFSSLPNTNTPSNINNNNNNNNNNNKNNLESLVIMSNNNGNNSNSSNPNKVNQVNGKQLEMLSKFQDSDEDWEDIEGQQKDKLIIKNINKNNKKEEINLDIEIDDIIEYDKEERNKTIIKEEKEDEEEEDWEDIKIPDKVPLKLTIKPTVIGDANKLNNMIHNMHTIANKTHKRQKSEDDWSDLLLSPSKPLQLKIPSTTINNNNNNNEVPQEETEEEPEDWDKIIEEEEEETEKNKGNEEEINTDEDSYTDDTASVEEEEEDWNELVIPSNGNAFTMKLTNNTSTPTTTNPSMLQEKQTGNNIIDGDENDWNDIVIPKDFASRLNTKTVTPQ